jgi:hypothetical protein
MSKISKFNQLARRGKSEIRRSKANVEGKPLMKKWQLAKGAYVFMMGTNSPKNIAKGILSFSYTENT